MIVWIFPLIAILGLTTAYFLKIHLSGDNLNHTRLCLGLVLNALFVIPYIDIVENNKFPVLGYRPDIVSDNPFIGWIAFASILLHSFSLPVKYEVKFWFSKK
ncbi:hypothetical protein ACYZT8_14965 [Pseudomonas sp. LB3P93]